MQIIDHIFNESNQILSQVWVVDPVISFTSGTASGGDELIDSESKDALRVGIQVLDPALLRPFGRHRQQVRRLAASLGTAFMGGYAIPDCHIQEFRNKVAAIIEKAIEEKNDLLEHIEAHIQKWADAHPDLREVILANRPTMESIEKSFRFGVRICKVLPPEPESTGADPHNSIHEEIRGLPMQIAREISQDVADSWVGDEGKGKTSQRVVSLVRRIHKKAKGLSFLDKKMQSLVDVIEGVLSSLPPTGPIEGLPYYQLVGLLSMLKDPHRILGNQDVILDMPEPEPDPEPVESSAEEEAAAQIEPLTQTPVEKTEIGLRVGWMF